MSRGCAECGRHLQHSSFSKNQWSKGAGTSRCNACVNKGPSNATQREAESVSLTSRYNDSTSSVYTNYDLEHPFGSGGFRWVAKGKYTSGERKGQTSVAKWFKDEACQVERLFQHDLNAVERAAKIIQQFNSSNSFKKIIRINRPAVWTFHCPHSHRHGKKVLSEPFIVNYQKFNSNTGWSDTKTLWPRVMQALSHFSYHVSSGQFVLCDLQGGVYEDSVVLSDPVVLSRDGRFGVTDLGSDGISSFFSCHHCNEFCKSDWSKPANPIRYYAPQEGTSMEVPELVPVASFRPHLAAFYEEYDSDYY